MEKKEESRSSAHKGGPDVSVSASFVHNLTSRFERTFRDLYNKGSDTKGKSYHNLSDFYSTVSVESNVDTGFSDRTYNHDVRTILSMPNATKESAMSEVDPPSIKSSISPSSKLPRVQKSPCLTKKSPKFHNLSDEIAYDSDVDGPMKYGDFSNKRNIELDKENSAEIKQQSSSLGINFSNSHCYRWSFSPLQSKSPSPSSSHSSVTDKESLNSKHESPVKVKAGHRYSSPSPNVRRQTDYHLSRLDKFAQDKGFQSSPTLSNGSCSPVIISEMRSELENLSAYLDSIRSSVLPEKTREPIDKGDPQINNLAESTENTNESSDTNSISKESHDQEEENNLYNKESKNRVKPFDDSDLKSLIKSLQRKSDENKSNKSGSGVCEYLELQNKDGECTDKTTVQNNSDSFEKIKMNDELKQSKTLNQTSNGTFTAKTQSNNNVFDRKTLDLNTSSNNETYFGGHEEPRSSFESSVDREPSQTFDNISTTESLPSSKDASSRDSSNNGGREIKQESKMLQRMSNGEGDTFMGSKRSLTTPFNFLPKTSILGRKVNISFRREKLRLENLESLLSNSSSELKYVKNMYLPYSMTSTPEKDSELSCTSDNSCETYSHKTSTKINPAPEKIPFKFTSMFNKGSTNDMSNTSHSNLVYNSISSTPYSFTSFQNKITPSGANSSSYNNKEVNNVSYNRLVNDVSAPASTYKSPSTKTNSYLNRGLNSPNFSSTGIGNTTYTGKNLSSSSYGNNGYSSPSYTSYTPPYSLTKSHNNENYYQKGYNYSSYTPPIQKNPEKNMSVNYNSINESVQASQSNQAIRAASNISTNSNSCLDTTSDTNYVSSYKYDPSKRRAQLDLPYGMSFHNGVATPGAWGNQWENVNFNRSKTTLFTSY